MPTMAPVDNPFEDVDDFKAGGGGSPHVTLTETNFVTPGHGSSVIGSGFTEGVEMQ